MTWSAGGSSGSSWGWYRGNVNVNIPLKCCKTALMDGVLWMGFYEWEWGVGVSCLCLRRKQWKRFRKGRSRTVVGKIFRKRPVPLSWNCLWPSRTWSCQRDMLHCWQFTTVHIHMVMCVFLEKWIFESFAWQIQQKWTQKHIPPPARL